jgi:hypothetical protein
MEHVPHEEEELMVKLPTLTPFRHLLFCTYHPILEVTNDEFIDGLIALGMPMDPEEDRTKFEILAKSINGEDGTISYLDVGSLRLCTPHLRPLAPAPSLDTPRLDLLLTSRIRMSFVCFLKHSCPNAPRCAGAGA